MHRIGKAYDTALTYILAGIGVLVWTLVIIEATR